jgi:hypothetical protein
MGLLMFQQIPGEPKGTGAVRTVVRPILGMESRVVLQGHEVRELLETDGTRVDAQSVTLAVVGEAPGMLIGLPALTAPVLSLPLSRKRLSGLLGLCEVHY